MGSNVLKSFLGEKKSQTAHWCCRQFWHCEHLAVDENDLLKVEGHQQSSRERTCCPWWMTEQPPGRSNRPQRHSCLDHWPEILFGMCVIGKGTCLAPRSWQTIPIALEHRLCSQTRRQHVLWLSINWPGDQSGLEPGLSSIYDHACFTWIHLNNISDVSKNCLIFQNRHW